MHSLFNPVQKRLATLEADSALVANPEPRLFSRLVVVIIIMIIANGCHAFTRAWAAIRSSTKIKKKQEIRPPDSRMCLYVCMYGIFQRENARLSLAGPERSGPAGRSVVIITALFYFIIFFFICSQTARQLVFHFLMFFFFIIIFVSCYVCSITAGICRSAWPYACVAACTYYPVTYTACGFKVWLPVCVCVCTLVCVCMSICVSVSVSVETSLSACMFIRVCKRVSCVYTCVYIYVIRSSYEFRRCVSIRKNGRVRMA